MRTFGKIFGGVLLILLLLIGGGLLYLTLNLDATVRSAVERYGPDYTGAPVAVDDVDIGITTGSGEIEGLVVGNPEGFEGDPAFRLRGIGIELEPRSLLDDVIVIRRVAIDGAELNAILQARGSNLQAILDNVRAATAAPPEAAPERPAKQVIIEVLDFTGATASVTAPLVGTRRVAIPDLHLEGIGRESNGVTAARALEQLLQPIIAAVLRQVATGELGIDLEERADSLRRGLEERAGSEVEGAAERLRGLNPFSRQEDDQAP